MADLLELMNRPLNRQDFEAQILQAAEDVPLLEPGWAQSEELTRFIDAWMNLATYYQLASDTVIAVEVVIEYDNFIRLLRKLMYSNETDSALREVARERVLTLEAALAKIAMNAVANLDSEGS